MGQLNKIEVWKTTYELCQGWLQRLEEESVRDETVVEITSVRKRLTLMVRRSRCSSELPANLPRASQLISSAGFGTSLDWPAADGREHVPFGHTLSFTQALSGTMKNVNAKLPSSQGEPPNLRLSRATRSFRTCSLSSSLVMVRRYSSLSAEWRN